MSQRYLVMGDNHGDTASLRRVLADLGAETVDAVVHVGDFTNAVRADRETAAAQLREVEPLLADLADHARHGLVWVWGNRDYFGDVPADLDVGTQVPAEGTVTVGGQRFTNSLAAVEPDVVLVTHMEYWRLLDHFEGRAHFCGNTHLGRHTDSRLNSAFLAERDPETGETLYGGYFLVEVGAEGLRDVEVRPIGDLERTTCSDHRERGDQFLPASRDCLYDLDDRIVARELAASAFYGLTHDADRQTVTDAALVDAAVDLWDDPPAGFEADFRAYLADVEDDRYAPLDRTADGRLRVAEDSYAY